MSEVGWQEESTGINLDKSLFANQLFVDFWLEDSTKSSRLKQGQLNMLRNSIKDWKIKSSVFNRKLMILTKLTTNSRVLIMKFMNYGKKNQRKVGLNNKHKINNVVTTRNSEKSKYVF